MICPKCKTNNMQGATSCAHCSRRLVDAESILSLDQKTGKPIGSIIVLGLSLLYLTNLTAGVDLLPDMIPVIGNLDEVGVVMLMLRTASNMGIWSGFDRPSANA